MKRVLIFLTCCLCLLPSCQSDDDKLTVIKGAGAANNSLLVGFNELCNGEAEGFIEGEDSILISRKSGNRKDFFKVNVGSKAKTELMSVLDGDTENIEMSKDSKKVIYNDWIYDFEKEQQSYLPSSKTNIKSNTSYFKELSLYSFSEEGEILYINPLYYIQKYYSLNKLSMRLNDSAGWMQVGDMGGRPYTDFKGIKAPDVDSINSPKLLLSELKYVFLGQKDGMDNNRVYTFDFFSKSFKELYSDVRCYSISPDYKQIAFITAASSKDSQNALCVGDLEGNGKRMLVTLPNIEGLQWSADGQWIAYSGGERGQKDIYIIKTDGTSMEQLTQGMNAGGKIAWKKSGDMIAFTSKAKDASQDPTVYIMKLSMKTEASVNSSYENTEKKELAQKLLSILKMETDYILKNAGKN